MTDLHNSFRNLVHDKGFRLTPQRQIILDAVHEIGGHCTPEEVYHRVQQKSTAINRATVYRTLEFLLKLGLVTSAHVQDNQMVYEVAGHTPHHHLICQRCEQVTQVSHHLADPFFQQVEQASGYSILTDHLVLFGLCPHCRAQN